MKVLRSNRTRSIIAVAFSLLILGFLFSKIDFGNVSAVILRSNFKLILLAAGISIFTNIFFGAVKWRRILSELGCPLSFAEVLSIRSGCIPFKTIFPLKSSEIFKAVYIHKYKGLSFGRAVSSLLLDKILNLLVTLAILLVGLFWVNLAIPKFLPIIGLLGIILFVFSSKVREGFLAPFRKVHSKIHRFTEQLLNSFNDISATEKVRLILYSVIYQFSEFINTYILFKAVGISVPFSSVCVLVPLIMIVNNLPITVLGLGTREALIIFLFGAFAASASLLGAGVLISLVEHVLPVVIGLLFIKSFLTYFAMKDDDISKGSVTH